MDPSPPRDLSTGFPLAPDPAFAGAPWQRVLWRRMGAARPIPTMLGSEERKLYFWLGAEAPGGDGAIVDLGCFAGGSTARLAAGAAWAGRPTPVHAYDRFLVNPEGKARFLYPAGVPPFEGEDLLPVARALLAPWADRVTLHAGDIEDNGWDGGPISVLVIDAGKTARSTDRIAADFFPSLVPGALVVHQDFLHRNQPWLAVQMELMAEWFDPIAFVPRDTVVFRLRSTPTASALAAMATDVLGDADMSAALAAAEARYAGWGLDGRIAALRQAMTENPSVREAWRFRRP